MLNFNPTSVTYKSNTTDVVSFVEKRLDPVEMNRIIKNYKGEGLKNTPQLKEYLGQTDYQSILVRVWAERDPNRRLAWLRKFTGMHARTTDVSACISRGKRLISTRCRKI